MADRVLAGSAPTPAEAQGVPPGALWVQVLEREADATGKTVKVNVYSTEMVRHIGLALGGPGLAIAGGPFINQVYPNAWEYEPSGEAPGLVQTADVVLPEANYYSVEVQGSSVRAQIDFQVGKPSTEQMGPYWSADAILENTYQGRQQKLRDEIRDMTRPTPIIGSSKKMKRTQGRTTTR